MASRFVRTLAAAAGVALTWPAAAEACSMVTGFTLYGSERSVALLVNATPDTAVAGRGEAKPSRYGGHIGPRRRGKIYGQVVQVQRAAGPAANGFAAGRAVLVPWDYDGACLPTAWGRSARWIPQGETRVITAQLRRREHWVDGVPTFDVWFPEIARPRADGTREPAPEVLFAYYSTLPTYGQLRADPRGAVAPMRAWLAANPAEAARPQISWSVRSIQRLAGTFAIQAEPSPLAGTYRFEVSRTGGPTHVFYGRTARRPTDALPDADTGAADFFAPAPGYRIEIYFHAAPPGLPAPDASRRRLEAFADEGAGHVTVRLPGAQGSGGTRRFLAWTDPVRFTRMFFAEDRVLDKWATELYVNTGFGEGFPAEPAEVVLWPDGRVAWKQVMRIRGQVVTFRGERISDVAWEDPTQGEPPPWVTYSPLLPLALLLFTGLYLFALPYAGRWRTSRRTG